MKNEELIKRMKTGGACVVGLGISNLPLVDFLLSLGVHVSARDKKTRAALGAVADDLEKRGVHLVTGTDYLDGIDEAVIFRSPGLRPDLPQFLTAMERGAVLTSEMELFMELTPATVIGVTGSDGKTTTTTLTGLMLTEMCRMRGYGTVYVGGNIGTPLLPRVHEMCPEDFAVVELSSFQLQTMRRSPDISAVTNLSPNHLNWHTGMEEYIQAKTNIYTHAPNRRLVINADNEITEILAAQTDRPKTYFSSARHAPSDFDLRPCDHAVYERDGTVMLFNGDTEHAMLTCSDILLPGRHNLENYMTAIALTEGTVTPAIISHVASTFSGVAHRLEKVRVFEGVTYYNSSIDSSPTRTAAALSALNTRPIVICGGSDKGISFAPLADALCERAKAVVLTGQSAPAILSALNEKTEVRDGTLPVLNATCFENAVHMARELAMDGDTVLLSPACASFDAFKNFEERGETFCRIVNQFD